MHNHSRFALLAQRISSEVCYTELLLLVMCFKLILRGFLSEALEKLLRGLLALIIVHQGVAAPGCFSAVVLSWEFERHRDSNIWCSMGSDLSVHLTKMFLYGNGGVYFHREYSGPQSAEWQWGPAGWVWYLIDFPTMTQTNSATGDSRRVRFIQVIQGPKPSEAREALSDSSEWTE